MYCQERGEATNSLLFAFVCFSNKQEAMKAMESLNNIIIRGYKIEAKEASTRELLTRRR